MDPDHIIHKYNNTSHHFETKTSSLAKNYIQWKVKDYEQHSTGSEPHHWALDCLWQILSNPDNAFKTARSVITGISGREGGAAGNGGGRRGMCGTGLVDVFGKGNEEYNSVCVSRLAKLKVAETNDISSCI